MEFGRQEFRLGRTRVGPSDDTLHRVILFVVEGHAAPEVLLLLSHTCKAWRRELDPLFCNTTLQLCSTLAKGDNLERLGQKAWQLFNAGTGENETERARRLDATSFLQRFSAAHTTNGHAWKGSLHQWLQAASQEPAVSFLSHGAASTAWTLGLPLVQWVNKPEERFPGLRTLMIPLSRALRSTAFALSLDGTRIASGLENGTVQIWDVESGALVRSSLGVHQCVQGGEVMEVFCGCSAHAMCWKWPLERVV